MIKKVDKSVQGPQKANNDDSVLCKTYSEPSFINAYSLVALAAVADGVGSVRGGHMASALAVKEIEKLVEKKRSFINLHDVNEFFKNTYREINKVILEEQEKQHFPDMCTTLVTAGLCKTPEKEQYYLFIANSGDSPLFCIDTDKDEVELLSMVHHEGGLTHYLGKRNNLEVHNSYCPCPRNGFVLICSDGLTGNAVNNPLISKEEIKRCLMETRDVQDAADELIKLAKLRGSVDDISVAILEVGKPKRIKAKRTMSATSVGYNRLAERLVYAGIIFIGISVVYYFKSSNDKLKKDVTELDKEKKVLETTVEDLISREGSNRNKDLHIADDWTDEAANLIKNKDKEAIEQKKVANVSKKEKAGAKTSQTKQQASTGAKPENSPDGGQGSVASASPVFPTTEGKKIVDEGPQKNPPKENLVLGEEKRESEIVITGTDTSTKDNKDDFKGIDKDSNGHSKKNPQARDNKPNGKADVLPSNPSATDSSTDKAGKTANENQNEKSNNDIIQRVYVYERKKGKDKGTPLQGVKITLDGESPKFTDENGMTSIKGNVGKHMLRAKKDGYEPSATDIIMSNKSDLKEIEFELKRKKN